LPKQSCLRRICQIKFAGNKHAEALETLKQNLISKPVLTGPKFDEEFLIFTDAAQKTVAAILAQKYDHGNENVTAYASRKVNC